jgi:hypothetical protein
VKSSYDFLLQFFLFGSCNFLSYSSLVKHGILVWLSNRFGGVGNDRPSNKFLAPHTVQHDENLFKPSSHLGLNGFLQRLQSGLMDIFPRGRNREPLPGRAEMWTLAPLAWRLGLDLFLDEEMEVLTGARAPSAVAAQIDTVPGAGPRLALDFIDQS